MEPKSYKDHLKIAIRTRIIELREKGHLTSKGEKISFAAIGRAADPPVSQVMVQNVVDGKAESRRVKDTIERELGEVYWIRKQPDRLKAVGC